MLRITRVASDGSADTLKLEGKLTGPWVCEFRRLCASLARPAGKVRLDLAAVSFVDGDGVRLLRELLAEGTSLAACSGLVAELLHVERP